MQVTEAVAIDHGLKKEEYSKICKLLSRFLKKIDPSSPERYLSIILSGWGIIPKTFFSLFNIPAIFLSVPFGFESLSQLPFSSQ